MDMKKIMNSREGRNIIALADFLILFQEPLFFPVLQSTFMKEVLFDLLSKTSLSQG